MSVRCKLRYSQRVRLATACRAERVTIEPTCLVGQPVSRGTAHVILTGDDAATKIRQVNSVTVAENLRPAVPVGDFDDIKQRLIIIVCLCCTCLLYTYDHADD